MLSQLVEASLDTINSTQLIVKLGQNHHGCTSPAEVDISPLQICYTQIDGRMYGYYIPRLAYHSGTVINDHKSLKG